MKLSLNKLTVYVPETIVSQAKQYALDNHTSVSAIVRKHLGGLVTKEKK